MAITYSLRTKNIDINDSESIIVETKSEEVYEWQEVSYRNSEEITFIGTYYTYDGGITREWMEHNENFIALISKQIIGDRMNQIKVKAMFDIKNKQLIEGNQEELISLYEEEFANKEQNTKEKPKKLVQQNKI